jgi:hypothetical protein
MGNVGGYVWNLVGCLWLELRSLYQLTSPFPRKPVARHLMPVAAFYGMQLPWSVFRGR